MCIRISDEAELILNAINKELDVTNGSVTSSSPTNGKSYIQIRNEYEYRNNLFQYQKVNSIISFNIQCNHQDFLHYTVASEKTKHFGKSYIIGLDKTY